MPPNSTLQGLPPKGTARSPVPPRDASRTSPLPRRVSTVWSFPRTVSLVSTSIWAGWLMQRATRKVISFWATAPKWVLAAASARSQRRCSAPPSGVASRLPSAMRMGIGFRTTSPPLVWMQRSIRPMWISNSSTIPITTTSSKAKSTSGPKKSPSTCTVPTQGARCR